MKNTRAIACYILSDIINTTDSLYNFNELVVRFDIPTNDIALIKATCYGVCRHYYLLKKIIDPHVSKKTKKIPLILLYIGLYQLKFMDMAAYAVINESVQACEDLKIVWAKKFINATLRKLNTIEITPGAFLAEIQFSFPHWMFNKIKTHYPDQWKEILQNSNMHPPMFLRVNTSKITKNAYLQVLKKNQLSVIPELELCKSAIYISKPLSVCQIPLFDIGYVSIQDNSAQLAVEILEPYLQGNVLDACAAPGGKTINLIDYNKDISITALDCNEARLKKLKKNINRTFPLYQNLKIICGSALKPEKWNEGNKYDIILLDAPCSATGVIRRNPDIKILRSSDDIDQITILQQDILQKTWGLLKDNGYLLYVTCSILPEENELQIKRFLSKVNNVTEIPIEQLRKYKRTFGYQVLPKLGDGFFYCLLQKKINPLI